MSECKFAVEAFHAYIESIGLSRPAGTLGELKAFKAGADWQRSQAQAELAELKAKAAVVTPERASANNTVASDAWRNGWNTCLDEVARLNSTAPSQPQSDGVIVPRELLERILTDIYVENACIDPFLDELSALLGGDQLAQPGSAKVGEA